MHPYIPHLLEDIKNAHRERAPLDLDPVSDDDLEQHFEEVERWLTGDEPSHTFSHYCGLTVEDFPPAEQLSISDMKLVSKAFTSMMFTWNLEVHFPEKLPMPIAYKMMVELLDTKTQIVNTGFIGFDFCTGNPEGCAFKEYCPCIEHWKEDDDIEGFFPDSDDDNDVPF